MAYRDITGLRSGFITAVRALGYYNQGREEIWLVQCDCGYISQVMKKHIVHKTTRTCGRSVIELHKEVIALREELNSLKAKK